MRRPSAPVEKSPLTGLTPECMPATDEMSTPSPTWRRIASWSIDPGARLSARQPTPGRRREAGPHRGAGRRTAGLAGRVGVVHELLQHAALDQRVAPGGEALAVGGRRGVGERVGGVVDQREERRRHVLAEPVGEQRAALLHGLARQRAAEDAEQLRGDVRVEHDGDPGARPASVAPSRRVARRAASAAATDEVEVAGLAPDREAEAGLGLVALGGQAVGGDVAGGRAGSTCGCRCWSPRTPSPIASTNSADSTPVMRGSAACTARSSSRARSTFLPVGKSASDGRNRSSSGTAHAVGLGQAEVLVGGGEARRCRAPRRSPRR